MQFSVARHRPASQAVGELMREFVERQQQQRDHTAFLQGKVDAAQVRSMAGEVARMKRSKPTSPPAAPG